MQFKPTAIKLKVFVYFSIFCKDTFTIFEQSLPSLLTGNTLFLVLCNFEHKFLVRDLWLIGCDYEIQFKRMRSEHMEEAEQRSRVFDGDNEQ